MKSIAKISGLALSVLLLSACGGSDNNDNVAQDKPKSMPETPAPGKITGFIEKVGGGYGPVTASDLEHTTYKGNIVVSLLKADAIMDMEAQSKARGGTEVDGDYLGIKLGDGLGGLHVYNDLSYARFGDISTYNAHGNHELSDTTGFYQGIPTQEMQAGGIVNYEGTAYQFGKDASGKAIADYNGKLNATADLSNSVIDIKLSDISVPVELHAEIRGTNFIATDRKNYGMYGGFFGPNGAEIAGMMEQKNNGEWTATFGGKRK